MSEPHAADVPDDIVQLLQSVGQLGFTALLVLGAILGLWLLIKIWPALSQTVAIGNALLQLPELVPQMQTAVAEFPRLQQGIDGVDEKVGKVMHEVFPNHGSSLRDKIDQTHDELIEYKARSEERLEGFRRDVASLRGSVTGLHKKMNSVTEFTHDATILEGTLTPAQVAVLRSSPHAIPDHLPPEGN